MTVKKTVYVADTSVIIEKKISELVKSDGIKVTLILPASPKEEKLLIEKFFDKHTMSLHIKENTIPVVKKGVPGNLEIVKVSDKKSTNEELKEFVEDIIEKTNFTKGAFIEINHSGTVIVQFQDFRIV